MHIVAANQHSAKQLWPYVAACLSLAFAFIILLLLVVYVPLASSVDLQLSQSLQTLRNPTLDKLMLGITMTADFVASASVIVSLTLLLFFARRWWLAIHMFCVYVAARMGVVVIKLSVARARPQIPEGTLEFFSFPSGHACAAAVIMGVVSLLIAYQQSARFQYLIIGFGIFLTVLVAVSRVYLLAHWPSDVIAGSLLGYTLVIAFAWQLHTATELQTRHLKPMVLILCTLSIGLYCYLFFGEQAAHYGINVVS